MTHIHKRNNSSQLPNFLAEFNIEFINVLMYNLKKEEDRKKSFIDNNWSNEYINVDELALLGFYFLQQPDCVKCAFCPARLYKFEPGDDVLREHIKHSPNCPLLKRRETGNLPINEEILNNVLPPVCYDEYGLGPSGKRTRTKSKEKLCYPHYKLPSKRLATFKDWPVDIKQKPGELVEAGFFYSGPSDLVTCFSCGITLGKWQTDDNPWIEHKKNLTLDCSYLKNNYETVKQNELKYEEFMKNKSKIEKIEGVEKSEPEIALESVCKVCMKRRSSILFLPCQHVVVCGRCVLGINDKCPYCRKEIESTIPILFA